MGVPDFWLQLADAPWRDAPEAIACFVIAGPETMMDGYDGKQWLVRVEPPVVEMGGVLADRVLVDWHEPDWRDGDDWAIHGTGAYALRHSVPEGQRLFKIFRFGDMFLGRKVVVTTRPYLAGTD